MLMVHLGLRRRHLLMVSCLAISIEGRTGGWGRIIMGERLIFDDLLRVHFLGLGLSVLNSSGLGFRRF